MEALTFELLEILKRHYSKQRIRSKELESQLKQLESLILADAESFDGDNERFLFFDDLTPEAQIEFLEHSGLEYDQIDQSRAIAKLTYLQHQ